jgi:hypothetical protein
MPAQGKRSVALGNDYEVLVSTNGAALKFNQSTKNEVQSTILLFTFHI